MSTRRGLAVRVAIAAIVLAACNACGSMGHCASEKCAARGLRVQTVHFLLDDKPVPRQHGNAVADVRIGRPITLSMSIDREKGTKLSNVYLFVSGPNWGTASAGPTGQVEVLVRHATALPEMQRVEASWTPSTRLDQHRVTVSTQFDVAGTRIGETLAELTLIP